MNRSLKIILATVLIIAVAFGTIFAIRARNKKKQDGKLNIVVTTFSCYDFSKQITGDNANVTLLLKPGEDSHSYEPKPGDLAEIKNADVFIYIGGDMEKWVDKILETDVIDTSKTKLIRVTDCIETIEEKEVDGAEEHEHHHGEEGEEHHHEEEEHQDGYGEEEHHQEDEDEEENHEEVHIHEDGAFDEHIWTSPSNAKKMVKFLAQKYGEIDSKNKEIYTANAEGYIKQIEDVEQKIQEIVDNKKRSRLVFGDKMPMQYFLDQYGLEVSAAFDGCSTEAEPSAKTVTYLINKVKEEKIPVVLYIELSTGKTAKSIAEATGAEAMQIQTLHNISKDDFESGETYVSLMNRNLDVLRKALQ